MPVPAPPRNAVELPIFTALKFGWWPPVQLSLARPWPDADHALRAHEARWSPDTLDALGRASFDPSTGRWDLAADQVLTVERPTRRGRRRARDSMQFVLQFGMTASCRAQALLQVWRDHAIEDRNLGTHELATKADRWWREVEDLEARVDQLIRRSKTKVDLRRHAILHEEICADARESSVIAARGTAALCGGAAGPRLLAAAFRRYRSCDATLHEIELPQFDHHDYAPEIIGMAAAFCAQGRKGLVTRALPPYSLRTVFTEKPSTRKRKAATGKAIERASSSIDL